MANYAYYALHEFHKWPSEFLNLPMRERAFIIASIDERVAKEKKEMAKANRGSKRKK